MSSKNNIYKIAKNLGLNKKEMDDLISSKDTLKNSAESVDLYKAGTKYGTIGFGDLYKDGTWYGTISPKDIYKAGTIYGSISIKDI